MRVCPTCKQRFPDGSRFCPYDGQQLVAIMVEEEAPVPADELLGQLLTERYRLETRLGEGGMGVVYGGRHVIIDKPVAVKVLRREYSQDPRQAERFLREAKAASRIGHPNVVDITDFGNIPSGQVFFVMEFLVGHTLAWEVRHFGAIAASRCLALANPICRALSAAHAKGIVHRDLKPENIFVVNPSTADVAARNPGHPVDTIKLLDFGIAKFAWEADGKRLTRVGSVFGTPQYMSPEQAAGQDADYRVDIYALGCILYEMLTGQLPFNADTFMGTLTMQIFNQPTPPRQLRPELAIPPGIEAVILRAMQKSPEDRYQSADEMAAALEACAEPDLQVSDTVPEPELERVRRATTITDLVPPLPKPIVVELPTRPEPRRGPGRLFWLPLLGIILAGAGVGAWLLSGRGPEDHRRAAGPGDARPRRAAPVDASRDVARRPDRGLDAEEGRIVHDARRRRPATAKKRPTRHVDAGELKTPPELEQFKRGR